MLKPPQDSEQGFATQLKKPHVLGLAALAIVLLIAVILTNTTGGPPEPSAEDKTEGRIQSLGAAIIAAASTDQRFPDSFAGLNDAKGKPMPATDGWGQPIQIKTTTTGKLTGRTTIRSIGKDKAPNTEDDYVFDIVYADDGYHKIGAQGTFRRGK